MRKERGLGLGTVEQPDIFDIEELRVDSEPDLGATAMPQNPVTRATPGAGDAEASSAAGVGEHSGKKGGKKSLRPCRGSQFTAASLRQTLDDTVSLSKVKEQLWVRVSLTILSFRAAGGAESLSDRGKAMLDSFYQAVMDAKGAARRVSDVADSTRADLERACAGVHGVSVGFENCRLVFFMNWGCAVEGEDECLSHRCAHVVSYSQFYPSVHAYDSLTIPPLLLYPPLLYDGNIGFVWSAHVGEGKTDNTSTARWHHRALGACPYRGRLH